MKTFTVALLLVSVAALAYGEDWTTFRDGFEAKANAMVGEVNRVMSGLKGTPEDKVFADQLKEFVESAIKGIRLRMDSENAEEQEETIKYFEGVTTNVMMFTEWAQDKSF